MMSDGSGSGVIEIPAGGTEFPFLVKDSKRGCNISTWMEGPFGTLQSKPFLKLFYQY